MQKEEPKVVVVLKRCALETVKAKQGFQLLSAEEHKGQLAKSKRTIAEYRPDIVHRVLFAKKKARGRAANRTFQFLRRC